MDTSVAPVLGPAGPTPAQQAANSNPNPNGSAVVTAPTVADLYGGQGSLDDQAAAADAAKTAVYDPTAQATLEGNARSDILSQYQSQIDGLDQAAAAARARITTAFAPIAAGRVGSATASEARRGLVGSDFGNAQTDQVNTQNTNDLNSQIAASDAQYADQKQKLLEFITGEQDKEITTRETATQNGADAKIAEIKDRQTRAQTSAQASVQAMLAAGINDPTNPNYQSGIKAIASATGLTPDEVTALYTTTKQTQDAVAAKATQDAATLESTKATTAKTTAETAATLTPEQVAADEKSKQALDAANIAKLKADTASTYANLPGQSSGGVSLPQVNMTADNVPDSAAQANFLKAIPDPNLQALITGIADYKINPNSLPTRQYKGVGGLTQSQVLSMVSQYDPSFSQSQYASRQALQTNFTSGKYSQNINSLNTAVGHISDILSNTKSVGNFNGLGAPLNSAKNAISSFFGSGAPGKANLNINAATSELATTFKGAGATDEEIKALGSIDANSSPDQVQSYIEAATQLLGSRLQALTDTYTSGMGKAPATPFLSQTSQAALQKLQKAGLNIDVPGLTSTQSIQDTATSAGYDYNAMKAAGYSDDQINTAISQ
jgi:hypothetical protein